MATFIGRLQIESYNKAWKVITPIDILGKVDEGRIEDEV